MVEAREELGEGFVLAANEHGEAAMFVGGSGDAADGFEDAERDLAVVDEAREVGQKLCDRVFAYGALAYGALAYAAIAFGGFFAMCQGSSSSMRLTGWSAMRSKTSRR